MTILSVEPMPFPEQPPTAGELAMMRDPAFPDVPVEAPRAEPVAVPTPAPPDTDVLSLLMGDVTNIQEWARALLKHAESNWDRIDWQLSRNLLDFATRVLGEAAELFCEDGCGRFGFHIWDKGELVCVECSKIREEARR